jgi:hypothetical protein
MDSLVDMVKRWPPAFQMLLILCSLISLDLVLLALLLLVIASPPAGAGSIMGIISVVQLCLNRRRRPTERPKPRSPKPP